MQTFRLAIARIKIHTSSCHFWNQESVFLQTLHHSLVPWNITLLYCFYLNLYLKKDPINVQIFRLSTVHMKINKLFMSFFEPQVSFTLNFASPFSVMTHNSSEIFWLKHYSFGQKRAYQYTIFQTFECSNESSTNSSYHFSIHKVKVYSKFASLFSVMKDNSSVFF